MAGRPIITSGVAARQLYREILRTARGFTLPHPSGGSWCVGTNNAALDTICRASFTYAHIHTPTQPTCRGTVLAASARVEFEAARLERDPEAITRMLVVGQDALQQIQAQLAAMNAGIPAGGGGGRPGASSGSGGRPPNPIVFR